MRLSKSEKKRLDSIAAIGPLGGSEDIWVRVSADLLKQLISGAATTIFATGKKGDEEFNVNIALGGQ